MMNDFKNFIMRGNVMDLAVGVIIGGAFGKIVDSMVNDLIMPIVGKLSGGISFTDMFATLGEGATPPTNATLAAAKAVGANTLNYGNFITIVVNFIILAFIIFMLVKAVQGMQKPAPAAAATTKECPFCKSTIALAATRCPNCTSEVRG